MSTLTPVESLTIPLNWRPVLVEGQIYPWHRKLQKYLKHRELITGPRIYRWVLKNNSGEVEAVYIGQGEKFQKRLAKYRWPAKTNAKSTDAIIKKMLVLCEEKGGTVELQFLEITGFEINGQLIDSSTKSLGNHEVRILLESIAIVTAKSEMPTLLNRLSKNVHEKDLESLLRSLPPKRQQEILDILKTNKQPS